MSTNVQMHKQMCHIHIREYYLAVKRKEVLIHAMTWMNCEVLFLFLVALGF
jgi:hypothetical protein